MLGAVVPNRAAAIIVAVLVGLVLATFAAWPTTAEARVAGDTRLKDGCFRADPSYFVQVQHGPQANSGAGNNIPTGYSRMGGPLINYWDQHTHKRCTDPNYPNDKYAVDYALERGDAVYSPFKEGTVTFAGRADSDGYRNYGILVVIEAFNGRYVSLSAHLDRIPRGLSKGERVSDYTIIGYAGNSGDPGISAGRVHLHQAFYRNPEFTPDGVPYGGSGLRVDRLRYSHGGGGVYAYGWERSGDVKAKGSLIGS